MEYYSALKSNELLRIPWTGSPVIRTQHFHCSSPGSITGQGTKILQAAWCSQKRMLRQGCALQSQVIMKMAGGEAQPSPREYSKAKAKYYKGQRGMRKRVPWFLNKFY